MDRSTHRIDLLEPLVLAGVEPLATGQERIVFLHPSAPGLIVKVVRPERRLAREQADRTWFRRGVRLRHYTLFLREIREYLALRARAPDGELPLARVVGLVETDLGLGQVSERIEYPDGNPSPTLRQMIEGGAEREPLREAVERLGQDLLRLDVVVNDLNPTNLVGCTGADGRLRFVLVDGFGDTNVVPLRSMFRVLNHRNTRKRIARILAALALAPPDASRGDGPSSPKAKTPSVG